MPYNITRRAAEAHLEDGQGDGLIAALTVGHSAHTAMLRPTSRPRQPQGAALPTAAAELEPACHNPMSEGSKFLSSVMRLKVRHPPRNTVPPSTSPHSVRQCSHSRRQNAQRRRTLSVQSAGCLLLQPYSTCAEGRLGVIAGRPSHAHQSRARGHIEPTWPRAGLWYARSPSAYGNKALSRLWS